MPAAQQVDQIEPVHSGHMLVDDKTATGRHAARVQQLGARCVATDHETLDLVYVEAFVDPGHQERLWALGLGTDLAPLPDLDAAGRCDQGEDAQGELGDSHCPAGAPAADPDVGLDLEVLPAGLGHRRSPSRD